MPGGLIQLLAWGNQNIYLNGNPSITFFKKIFQTHTNFSMESIRVNLSRTDANIYEPTIFKAKIDRHGDLIQQIYFVFELPDIISETDKSFRWVDYIGEAFIDNYRISVGGSTIDRQTGEFLHIINSLTLDKNKRELYERMIGHTPEMTRPQLVDVSIPDGVSGFVSTQYPASTNAQQMISIKGRKVYVPLNFWFNRESGQALPLVALQYSDTEVTIEVRPLAQLYKLLKLDDGFPRYVAPDTDDPEDRLAGFVANDFSTYLVSDTVLDVKAYLEVNYVFLDTLERKYLAYNPLQYLVEQTARIEFGGLGENNTFDLVLQNPIKELLWVCKRNDLAAKNNWFEFTDYRGANIMKTARIMFNGLNRMEDKDAMYYSHIQPWQHHSGCSQEGVYMYSFAINPEDHQPSGAVNASRIKRFQLVMSAVRPIDSSYEFGATVYAINYNILRISSGLAGLVYAS
jgi:hypothetical protein